MQSILCLPQSNCLIILTKIVSVRVYVPLLNLPFMHNIIDYYFLCHPLSGPILLDTYYERFFQQRTKSPRTSIGWCLGKIVHSSWLTQFILAKFKHPLHSAVLNREVCWIMRGKDGWWIKLSGSDKSNGNLWWEISFSIQNPWGRQSCPTLVTRRKNIFL